MSENRAANTSVPAQHVINQLHQRYTKTIAQLTQEVAELISAVDSIAAERDEYKARVLAFSDGPAYDPLAPIQGVFRQEGQPDQVVQLHDVTDAMVPPDPREPTGDRPWEAGIGRRPIPVKDNPQA